VTDGSINATLPKGTEPEDVDLDLAVDLLAKKAARKGGKKGRRGKK
jgi:DNA topoisomerase-1